MKEVTRTVPHQTLRLQSVLRENPLYTADRRWLHPAAGPENKVERLAAKETDFSLRNFR